MSENTSLTKDASFRYANALFNLALETNSAHKFEEDLDKILKIINETQQNNFELITTEKDFYKIKNLNLPQIKYLKLDLVFFVNI